MLDAVLAVIGVIGTAVGVVAIPTVFQMFGGAPKLTLTYGSGMDGDVKHLYCVVRNEPVTNRLYRLLRVTRQSCDAEAGFQICKEGDEPLGNGTIRAIWTESNKPDQASKRVTLGTIMPRSFNVAIWHEGRAIASHPHKEDDIIEIPPGTYVVNIAVIYGDQWLTESRELHIGNESEKTFWC
jgi:hypothetical protein